MAKDGHHLQESIPKRSNRCLRKVASAMSTGQYRLNLCKDFSMLQNFHAGLLPAEPAHLPFLHTYIA